MKRRILTVFGLALVLLALIGMYFLIDEKNGEFLPLTAKEQLAYEEFKASHDTAALAGLEPLSVAKLYIHAGYEQDYDTEYALYTDRKEYIMWSLEEHRAFPETDRITEENIRKTFAHIAEGEFVQTSDHQGYIRFYPNGDHGNPEDLAGFQLVQNEDGVWQVGFNPIQ